MPHNDPPAPYPSTGAGGRNEDRAGDRRPTAGSGDRSQERLVTALGWASVGLGLPLLTRAGDVTRLAGVGDGTKQRAVGTFVGAREFVSAAGLFHPELRRHWVWTRVAGDLMDLAVLGKALADHDGKGRNRTVAVTAAIAGITAIDGYAAFRQLRMRKDITVELTGTTTVRKDPQEVYAYWRDLERLPDFMAHVEAVSAQGGTRSHWRVTAPFGKTVEWDAEITDDQPGRLLCWRSVEGADITNSGRITFAPAPKDQGTEIHVTISYDVPGGKLGEALARWAGEDPHQQLDDDLRRFKQVMETGEVVRSEGAPWGKKARQEFPQHPVQPLDDKEMVDLTREEVSA